MWHPSANKKKSDFVETKTCDDQGQFSTLKINAKFREVFNPNFGKKGCVFDPDK